MTEQRFRLPIIAKFGDLGITYTLMGNEIVVHDWENLSVSVQDVVKAAARRLSFEETARPIGPFIPITVARKLGPLIALRIEEQFSFRLVAERTLEVWFMGGAGEGADTKIRFQNLTDSTTVKATALIAAPGVLEGDGITPLVSVRFSADKTIAFEAINENLLTTFSLGGFGVFTIV